MFNPQKIWASRQLPSLPHAALRLLDLTRKYDSDLREIVAVLRTDPALSAKILKAANSSFFGLANRVVSVDQAVPLLGTTVITSLALSFSLTEGARGSGRTAPHYERYWRQSIVQATAAETIARRFSTALSCEYFLAGLLTDIGRLAMLKAIPDEYLPVLEAAEAEQRPLHEIETREFGMDHAQIGATLMEQWNLPQTLISCCRWQHVELPVLRELTDEQGAPLVRTVALAGAIGDYFCAPHKGTSLQQLQALSLEFFKLDAAAAGKLVEDISERMSGTADLLQTPMADFCEPAELMAEANQQLAQLTLQAHAATTQAAALRERSEREKRELESSNAQLRQEAIRDPLTKQYNRRFFEENLKREAANSARHGSQLGVLFIDIDHFKQVNDEYGHAAGDEVLVRVATVLAETVRTSDLLARHGGEEFVVLMYQPTEGGMLKLAERLRTQVAELKIDCADTRVGVTVSIGAALGLPERGQSDISERLLAAADEAMYQSKSGGRNQVHFTCLIPEVERRIVQESIRLRFSRWLVARKLLTVQAASQAMSQHPRSADNIGTLARKRGWLTDEQVELILEEQQLTGRRFGEIALQMGFLTERKLILLLVLQQEDPLKFSQNLVRLKLLQAQDVSNLLKEYVNDLATIEHAPEAELPAEIVRSASPLVRV